MTATPNRIVLRCPKCHRAILKFEHERRKIVRCKECREPLELKGVVIGELTDAELKAIEDNGATPTDCVRSDPAA